MSQKVEVLLVECDFFSILIHGGKCFEPISRFEAENRLKSLGFKMVSKGEKNGKTVEKWSNGVRNDRSI